VRVELHVEIKRFQVRKEKIRRNTMARSMMGFGLHPLPLFLKGMSLGESVKWQTHLVEQHPETAPIPGRQLRIMVTDEDAARTNKPGGLGKHRRHGIAVMQGRIQRDDVGELGGQRKIVRVCLERTRPCGCYCGDLPWAADWEAAAIISAATPRGVGGVGRGDRREPQPRTGVPSWLRSPRCGRQAGAGSPAALPINSHGVKMVAIGGTKTGRLLVAMSEFASLGP
jgi:hypothetical protein